MKEVFGLLLNSARIIRSEILFKDKRLLDALGERTRPIVLPWEFFHAEDVISVFFSKQLC